MAISITSPTGIANMALSHIGAGTIESIEADEPIATQCRIWYDVCRRQALEAYNWGFARKRQEMALHGNTISDSSNDPLAGVWGFRYQYPADAIVLRKIQNPNAPPDDATPYSVETSLSGQEKTVLTNVEEAVAVYTYDAQDTGLFSPLFIRALSHLLAASIAFNITGKQKLTQQQGQAYQLTLLGATAASANESVEPPPRDADWTRARTGSAAGAIPGAWRSFPDASN